MGTFSSNQSLAIEFTNLFNDSLAPSSTIDLYTVPANMYCEVNLHSLTGTNAAFRISGTDLVGGGTGNTSLPAGKYIVGSGGIITIASQVAGASYLVSIVTFKNTP